MKLTLKEWANAAAGEILAGEPGMFVGGDGAGGLSIDSRTISEGEWFVALTGKSGVNGHRFLETAVGKGAEGLIVSNREEYELKIGNSYPDLPALLVKDTTIALADAARAMLDKYKPFVIAITGTVGKTSVKEAVAHIASKNWPTLKTLHNWNTEIGLPLTVFNINPDHKVAVLECASRGAGQIMYLSMIARPDIAVITSIGAGHLSEFGSVDDVASAKWEIVDGLKNNGHVITSSDPVTGIPYVEKFAGDANVQTFGTEPESDFRAVNIARKADHTEFEIVTPDGKPVAVSIPGTSRAEVMNALTAFCCCLTAKVDGESIPVDEIVEAMKSLPTTPGRLETIIRESGIEVIFDGYNSNPISLENAIEAWAQRAKLHDGSPVKRHVAILGDMLELGENEIDYHLKAGENVADHLNAGGILMTVGPLASHIRKRAEEIGSAGGEHFETTEQCAGKLKNILKPGDLVLIKASRSLAFEKLLREEW